MNLVSPDAIPQLAVWFAVTAGNVIADGTKIAGSTYQARKRLRHGLN